MDFLFAGLPQDRNADPYDSLSELCTILVVAEEGLAPIEPVTDTVLKALRKSPNSGDVQVMAARALALLLDKFTPSFSIFVRQKGPSSVTDCFKSIFALVSDPKGRRQRTFAKATQAELTEELLKCLTLGSSSTPAVRSVMPSTEVQLRFCEASLDSSKWTSCKVLRHCALLARCGGLETEEQQRLVKKLLYRHLLALGQLHVDYEWDELLRTVTEGMLTLRVWCGDAAEGTTGKKRIRDGIPCGKTSGGDSSVDKSTEEHFVDVCARVCANPGIADTRKVLVLACTNAALHARDVATKIPRATRVAFIEMLIALLQDSSQSSATFSNPFARKDQATSEAEDEDGFKPLPNLQWEVPSAQWSALMLLAKLLGAEPATTKDYVWGWRGEGELWYWYRRNARATLTARFFRRQPEVRIRGSDHRINLVSMTDVHRSTRMVARIHFQPVPYAHTLESGPLTSTFAADALLAEYAALMPRVRQLLRAVSFGTTPLARLAKAVYLHVVCQAAPDSGEETKAAFRNLVAEYPAPVLEKLAKGLIGRDCAWAAVLCDAGIADALGDTRAAAAPPAKRARPEPRRHSATPELPPQRWTGGESPVAKLLRGVAAAQRSAEASQAQSAATTPQLAPMAAMQLPGATAAAAAVGLASALQQASFADTVLLLQDLFAPAATAAPASADVTPARAPSQLPGVSRKHLTEAARWLKGDADARGRVATALTAVLLRELQLQSIEGKRKNLADAVADEALLNITVCDPTADSSGGGSSAETPRCPAGHSLRVHFSTNWSCNRCHMHMGYGSSACRPCNYDLCHDCAEKSTNWLEVNPTACVGDVGRVWLSRRKQQTSTAATAGTDINGKDSSARADSLYALFTSAAVLPSSAPSKSMTGGGAAVHCGHAFSACFCGAATCPATLLTNAGGSGGSLSSLSSELEAFAALLSACAAEVAADSGVLHALVEAVESRGASLFLDGISALPLGLDLVLRALSARLPLSLKVDMAKFLAIDCRRYALFHLQESGLFLRGSVQGEIGNNGLAQKFVVKRGDVEATTVRLFAAFASMPSIRNKVEFSFEDEEGTGNGPTQELYTELSAEYRGVPKMWYTSEDSGMVLGFPSCTAVFFEHFFVLGAACARAFVDGYVMDIEVLPCVWPLLRLPTGDSAAAAAARLATLTELDPALVRSYERLMDSTNEELDSMALFDDDDAPLTTANVRGYVARRVAEHFDVAQENIRAMGLGLLTAVDLAALRLFSDDELSAVLYGQRHRGGDDAAGGDDRKFFTEKELRAVTLAAHGYSADSKEVDTFLSIVGDDFGREQQAFFLEFLTGSARLPLNGLAGLARSITVVKKDMDDSPKQQTLPSCNTCFLYLKLPPYTTRDVMKDRLLVAITEGRKNFSLS